MSVYGTFSVGFSEFLLIKQNHNGHNGYNGYGGADSPALCPASAYNENRKSNFTLSDSRQHPNGKRRKAARSANGPDRMTDTARPGARQNPNRSRQAAGATACEDQQRQAQQNRTRRKNNLHMHSCPVRKESDRMTQGTGAGGVPRRAHPSPAPHAPYILSTYPRRVKIERGRGLYWPG